MLTIPKSELQIRPAMSATESNPKLSDAKVELFETNVMLQCLRNVQINLKHNVKKELEEYEQFHLDASKAILIALQHNKLKKLETLKEKQLQIMDKMADYNHVLSERDDLKDSNRRLSDYLKVRGGIRLNADQQLSALQQAIYKDLRACVDDSISEIQDMSVKLEMMLGSDTQITKLKKNELRESETMNKLQKQINILKLIIVEYQERQFHIKTKSFTILDSLIEKMQQLDDLEQLYKNHKAPTLP